MKNIKQIVLAIFISVFSVGVAKGFYKEYTDSEKISENILQVLRDNCDCEEITLSIYSKGIQFNKEDGFTTVKAEYQLTDCNYANFNDEVIRIDNLLQKEVACIKDFDIISLDFVTDNQHKTVDITNRNFTKNENE